LTKLEKINNARLTPNEFQAPTADQKQAPKFAFTAGHWLLLTIALLCLLFILFITFARSIEITTVAKQLDDDQAIVSVSSDVALKSLIQLPIGNRILVLPGGHRVSVEADGFEPLAKEITVTRDRVQSFELKLTRLAGNLDIKLTPKVNAVVMINGESVGVLPGLIENVEAGQQQLTIDAPLYRKNSQSILVLGEGKTQELSMTLEPAWAEITINSKPSGAQVWFNDERLGVTPLQTKVEEGNGLLKIQAEKFKTHEQELNVVAQQAISLPLIELNPADAMYQVTTTPQGAAVIVEGEYQGISPLNVAIAPNREHTIQIYKAGYQLESERLNLQPSEQLSRDFELQQDLVSVRFSVSPSDADIYIDGVKQLKGKTTIAMNTMPHSVRVTKPGYVEYKTEIVPTKNSQQVVSVKLLTKEQFFWANVPDTYTTKAGQSMKLFRAPGLVKMGSSRREAGRRSNEVSYQAKLTKHFYASLHEVTNKQFRLFKPTHNSSNYKRKSLDAGKHPVVNVSWQQAALYCNWLSKKEGLTPFYQTESGYVSGNNVNANGYRLLTEVEWAWLARNKDGGLQTYPWGNSSEAPVDQRIGNYADNNALGIINFTLENYNDGYSASSPVGKFNPNHRGLYDMGGNVSEWVNDWYSANTRLAKSNSPVLTDWLGPDIGEFHVVRGASWAKGYLPQLRLAYRDYGAKGRHDIGFRIGRYVGSPQ